MTDKETIKLLRDLINWYRKCVKKLIKQRDDALKQLHNREN